jgi:acyl dehydratase
MKDILDTRTYQLADQRRFAALSGDANPIHLDPIAARRELFGDVVVHGMHLVLRALDAWLSARSFARARSIALHALRVSFTAPVPLDRVVETRLVSEDVGRARLDAWCDGRLSLHAEVEWGEDARPEPSRLSMPPYSAHDRRPRILERGDLGGRAGSLTLWADRDATSSEFPDLVARSGLRTAAELLTLSRLVGMHCPGLRSLFSGFELERRASFLPPGAWRYAVTRVLPGTSLVQIDVESARLAGRLDTFLRPAPQLQPAYAEVAERVEPGEFAGQRALVVGGSRGIGEVTAKIVAAGGGLAVATWHTGREDAEALAAEIRAGGGRCETLACDVEHPGPVLGELQERDLLPTHLYYFASPRMYAERRGGFCPELHARFAAVYVDGLAALLLGCRNLAGRELAVFYPSTAALDGPIERKDEYLTAKSAGERLCREFGDADPKLRVRAPRLPRIATDQTRSPAHVATENALDVMLPEVRALAATSEEARTGSGTAAD